MKQFITISRLLVGSLFIVSGLIKCNDSIGFSYKLNDYFAQDVLNMEFLIPYSLGLAVIICVVEIVLGVALIFGFKSKLTTSLILLMMLFFTWLTWYTSSCLRAMELATEAGLEFSKNCVTDCGCFGDALKLKPIESFYKDLVLLVFTIPLCIAAFKNKIKENTKTQDLTYIALALLLILVFGVLVIKWWFTVWFSLAMFAAVYLIKNKTKKQWLPLLVSYIFALGFTLYCLQNLPIKDFRPYKIGNNIAELMTTPPNAPKPVLEYTWTFNVNGTPTEFVTNGSYPEVDGDYVKVTTKTIDEGYIPPIQDFTIETMEDDLTEQFLNTEKLIMVTMYNVEKSEKEGLQKLQNFANDATQKGYTVIGLTASNDTEVSHVKQQHQIPFSFYLCDEKVIKTIVRSNPGIVVLNRGTITNKAHYNNIEAIEL